MRVNIHFFALVPAVLGFPNFFWSSPNTTTSYTVASTTTESSSVLETGTVVILNIPTTSTEIPATTVSTEEPCETEDGSVVILNIPSTSETTTTTTESPTALSSSIATTPSVVYTYESSTTVDGSVVILNIPSTTETTTTTSEIPTTTTTSSSLTTTQTTSETSTTVSSSITATPHVVYTYETSTTVDGSVVILNIPSTTETTTTTKSVVPVTTTTTTTESTTEICETTVDGSVVILNIPSTTTSSTTTTETTTVAPKTTTITSTLTVTTVVPKTIEIFQNCTTSTTSSWAPKMTTMVYKPKKHCNSTCPVQPLCIAKESFCSSIGQGNITINGTQVKTQSCSNTPMGTIPSFDNMVSTLIRSPANGEIVLIDQNITVRVQAININYGFFEDPSNEYYLSPQKVGANGNINGHTHIVIEKILDGGNFPDPRTPLFFEGLNDPSDETNSLSALVLGSVFTDSGPGTYRICTITSSQGHQSVLLPVARRGSTDDCIRIVVI